MAKGFNPNGTWTPKGRGFNMGVVQHDGHVIHLTGQVAWDENEKIVGKGDIETQTRQCFKNIKAVLSVVGGRLEDIVSFTTYFTDRSQLPVIQRVRAEYLRQESAPASTSVMVAGLGHEDFLVELTPVAVVPTNRFIAPAWVTRSLTLQLERSLGALPCCRSYYYEKWRARRASNS